MDEYRVPGLNHGELDIGGHDYLDKSFNMDKSVTEGNNKFWEKRGGKPKSNWNQNPNIRRTKKEEDES